MGHEHTETHDSHTDHHDHEDHGHHEHIQIYPEAVKQKLEWLYTPFQSKSLRTMFMERYFHSQHHPHAYDINSIDESDHKKNIDRIVFALEKLAALNHHAFAENERRILTPTRTGIIQKAYIAGLNFIPAFLAVRMFITRNVGLYRIMGIFGFVAFSNSVLKPAPHYFKEKYRLSRARKVAAQYYALKYNKFDDFRMILDPKTPLEVLAHYSLSD